MEQNLKLKDDEFVFSGPDGPSDDWFDQCEIVPAKTLPGWNWRQYNDGSGSLESPEGKSYFGYDLSTHEFQHPGVKGNNWRFFSGYPYNCIGFAEFKERAEHWITTNIIEKAKGAVNG